MIVVVNVVIVRMAVVVDALIKVVGIDGDLNNVQLRSIQIEDEEAHAIAFGTHEDEGLFISVFRGAIRIFRRGFRMAAGFANDAFPSGTELLLDHRVQFLAVDGCGEVVELGNMQVAYALVGRLYWRPG